MTAKRRAAMSVRMLAWYRKRRMGHQTHWNRKDFMALPKEKFEKFLVKGPYCAGGDGE